MYVNKLSPRGLTRLLNMRITILGSGSRGNCTIVETENHAVMIDAGFSGKQTTVRMEKAGIDRDKLDGLLISHEHTDHISGARVIGNRWNVPVFANRGTARVLKDRNKDPDQFFLFMTGSPFTVGDIKVTPFSVPHDAEDPVAFVLEAEGKRVAIATDLGLSNRLLAHQIKGCEVLVIESNYDFSLLQESKRPWNLRQRVVSRIGHLSNVDAVNLLKETVKDSTQLVVMAHVSKDCNKYDIVKDNAYAALQEINQHERVQLHVATQDDITGPFVIE